MKILIDASGVGPGGLSRVLVRLTEVWSSCDQIAIVAAPASMGSTGRREGVTVISEQRRTRAATILSAWVSIYRSCREFDAVLSMSPSLAVVGCRVPVVTVFNDLLFVERPDLVSRWARAYRAVSYRAALRWSYSVACISKATAQSLSRWAAGRLRSTPKVVPLSGELEGSPSTLPAALANRLGEAEPLIVAPGHAANKGIEHLLRALQVLSGDWAAVVLAGNAEMLARWVALAREIGLADRVTVLDWIPDSEYLALLDRASLFVMLSEAEGFGLPAVEAAQRGVQVLIAPEPALMEACAGRAVVCESRDADTVAQAIADGLKRPRRADSVPGRSWVAVSEDIRSLLGDIVDR